MHEEQTSKVFPFLHIHNSQQTLFLCHFATSTIRYFEYLFVWCVQLHAESNNRPIVCLAFPGTMSWLGPREFLGFNESPSRSVRACCGCNEVVIFLSPFLSHSANSCPWLHVVWILFIGFFFFFINDELSQLLHYFAE